MLIRPMMLRGAAGGGGVTRPQDVYATSLYTGNGGSQTITNGLNLAGSGGLVWTKSRVIAYQHELTDSVRGAGKGLRSNTTGAEDLSDLASFLSNGFSLAATTSLGNASGQPYAAWSFRRAAKFFDIVTYAGDSTSGRQIPHGLGIAPGMIVVKTRNIELPWAVQHRSLSPNGYMYLSRTDAYDPGPYSGYWQNTVAGPTTFTLGTDTDVNAAGGQYVAYLFAHDPDTTNGIIQCGSGNATLPWPVQWVLYRDAGAVGNWMIADSARGFSPSGSYPTLFPNTSGAETASGSLSVSGNTLTFSGMTNPVWVAIRSPT